MKGTVSVRKWNTEYVHSRTLLIYQLTHTTLRSVELLKHSKIDKNAPTTSTVVPMKSEGLTYTNHKSN